MFDKIIEIVAPHHCYSCQKTGSILCDSCIYNIADSAENTCISCQSPCLNGVCPGCSMPYAKAWVAGARENELSRVIGDFKWSRKYGAHTALSKLLHNTLPILPSNTVVVPIPTISRHRRIRGYDHADLIAKEFAKRRKLKKQNLLGRKNNSIQHTANRSKRHKQAQQAFYCNSNLNPAIPYLIIDDIVTTGATIKAATRVLKGAGANEVWVAAVARQVLT